MDIALEPPPLATASPVPTSCTKLTASAPNVGKAALIPERCSPDRAVLLAERTSHLFIVDVPVLRSLPRAVCGGVVEAASKLRVKMPPAGCASKREDLGSEVKCIVS